MSQTLTLYIPKVLNENKVVLLKGIGSFRLKFRSANLDPELSVLTPPREEILFLPANVQVLDPVLVQIVQMTTKGDRQEATDLVGAYMLNLRNELNVQGVFFFPGLGEIRKDFWGHLFFQRDPEYYTLNPFFGLWELELPEALSLTKQEVIAADIRETVSEKPAPAEIKSEKEKGRRWGFLIGAAALILTLISLLYFLNWDLAGPLQVQDPNPADLAAIPLKRINIHPADPISGDHRHGSARVDRSSLEPGPNYLPQAPDATKISLPEARHSCVIVVGAFANPKNVNRMVHRIEEYQYKPVVLPGVRLTKVGFQVDYRHSGPPEALDWAREEFDPAAWVLKYD